MAKWGGVHVVTLYETAWPGAALDQAPHAYEIFQRKQGGAIKVVLQP